MATVLENYYALRGELEQRMAQAPINAVDLWYYGEIVYRVGRVGDLSDVPAQCACFDEYPRTAGALPDDGRLCAESCVGTSLCAGPRSGYTRKSGKPLRVTWDV